MIACQKVHSFVSALNYNNEKLHLLDKSKRAELLAHNFLSTEKDEILEEVKLINSLNTRVKNDGYHVALSFSEKDKIDDDTLIAIADDYKKGMGFTDDHLFLLYKHNDGDDHRHIHVHILLHRLAIDPDNGRARLVSDSHNFQRSEKLCRQLEHKYGLEVVPSSKEALDRAPTKNELEMIERTGRVSERMLLQEKVKLALDESTSLDDFIKECSQNGVYLLLNQSETTGHISGITYISENGFICKGKKLGNQFKWGNLKSKINYEQSRDRTRASEANRATREKFRSLLERDQRGEKMDGGAGQTSRSHHEKSSSSSPNDGGASRKGTESRSEPRYSGAPESTNGIQKNENADHYQFSDSYSSSSRSISSNSYPVSDVDDEEEERKRKRKWRRRR